MDVAKMRCNYTHIVLCIFDKRTGRKWTRDWEEPGWIGDEHAQEREQGLLVLMAESGETTM